MTKNEIADVLGQIATLLELKGENPFKIRAYASGARLIDAMDEAELVRRIEAGELEAVRGIGEALSKKIDELHKTGRLEFFEKLKASVAPGLIEMLEIPGLGPKKIKALHEKLGVDSIAGLQAACEAGRVAELAGFGGKSQEKLLEGIKNRIAYGKRHLRWSVSGIVESVVAGLRALPQVRRAEAAGSFRRGMETVGDVDFLVAATDGAPVVDWFVAQPGVQEITARGETKASVRFESGLQADLRIVPETQFFFALHHFTGSKDHNVQMRHRALTRGVSLSEWGIVPALGEGNAKEKAERGESLPAGSETEVFRALGLPYIPPELREGLGEIEAAERGELPRLVECADLRGAWHNHTTASDGRSSLAEMVAGAVARGWEYLGIADHSKSSFQTNGLSEERLLAQLAEIRAVNASGRFPVHVFSGTECDILADGRLDFDESVRRQLDYVVVSVHNAMGQDEETMTQRLIRAIEQPYVTMLGHVTGRLLLRREPCHVNIGKVLDAALANGVLVELNANPMRLDMDWRHWRKAAERGMLCAINPDAHDVAGLDYLAAGVQVARKGWLTKENVLNTRPLADVQAHFRRRMGA